MNFQPLFFLKYTTFILFLLPSFFYCLENRLFRLNGFIISEVTQEDSKDIQESFYESQDNSFPSNPNDLLNILQRIEAMNDGTDPNDSIDDALKAFEIEDRQEPAFDSGIPSNNPTRE